MGKIMIKKMTILLFTTILIAFAINIEVFGNNNSDEQNNDESKVIAYLMAVEIVNDVKQDAQKSILDNQRIRIINLGPVVNHPGVDYAPTVSADGRTLFFVSNRVGSRENNKGPSHDFWATTKKERLDTIFTIPYNIDTLTGLDYLNVNTIYNEGAASIAADRQSLYFTACDRPDGYGNCDIYFSKIEGDKWGRPVNLGPNVNSDNFDSQPSISADNRRLYFVSSRKGPNSDGKPKLENMDIWYSDRDQDTDEWLPAQNLTCVNTSKQEFTPFIAADGVTLFFASNGHKPLVGGLDFFKTTLDLATGTCTKPENLGEPINTKDDEMFISLPASGDIIYFSSRRTDLPGSQGDLDVFMAFVPSFFKAVNLITTVVDECSGEFIPAKITVRNPITNRIVHDELTFSKQNNETIIGNADYGNPKDSLEFVDIEITAENPKYGKKTVVQRVERPSVTENPDEAAKPDEIRIKITLGQRPVLTPDIEESEYVRIAKRNNPKVANFRGLVMKETITRNLYPLLNYVFFDEGKSDIPERYILFDSPEQTKIFADTSIFGGTLDKYYHILNIYGYRLKKNPNVKIQVIGCNDGESNAEKNNIELSKRRATNVYNYLKNIWGIEESRMELKFQHKPTTPTNTKVDSIGLQENRRVEIITTEWEVVKPVFDVGSVTEPQPVNMNFLLKNGIEDELVEKRRIEILHGKEQWNTLTEVGRTDPKILWNWKNNRAKYPTDEQPFTAQLVVTTKSGAECKSDPVTIPVLQISTDKMRIESTADSTREIYNLILFPFDRSDAGPINERIMNDYVYGRVYPTSVVEVVGHTDIVGMYDHNKKLSERRSEYVKNGINKKSNGRYGKLASRGVGEEDPLYTNDLPEGRFYNRTVQVIIKTPLSEFEEK